jgi:hypothetical protein
MNAATLNGIRMVADAMVMPRTMTASHIELVAGVSAPKGRSVVIGGIRRLAADVRYVGAAVYVWSDTEAAYVLA